MGMCRIRRSERVCLYRTVLYSRLVLFVCLNKRFFLTIFSAGFSLDFRNPYQCSGDSIDGLSHLRYELLCLTGDPEADTITFKLTTLSEQEITTKYYIQFHSQ